MGLEEWWIERTAIIAELVPPQSRVIEFGAGRRQLERFLSPDSSYVPSDLVDRGAGTIVCDLNCRPLPDFKHLQCNVAVFGGVLEYIRDVSTLVQWVACNGIEICIASFDSMREGLGFIGRYQELKRRSYYGYMNALTESDLLRAFRAAGYTCEERRTWTAQVIFRFSKRP